MSNVRRFTGELAAELNRRVASGELAEVLACVHTQGGVGVWMLELQRRRPAHEIIAYVCCTACRDECVRSMPIVAEA
jgi:hypothetical protein